MKLAICLFGNVGGKIASFGEGGFLNPKFAIKNYLSHVAQDHDVDFFVHSWSEEYEADIVELCQPKMSLFEKQIDFTDYDKEKYNYEHYQMNIDELIKKTGCSRTEAEKDCHINTYSAHSRLYSVQKVVDLMSKFSEENDIIYDFVIQLRLDLIFYKKIEFHTLNREFVYYPKRHSKDDSVAADDYYIIASMANMKKFSGLYDARYDFNSRTPVATVQYLKHLNIPKAHYGEILYSFCLIRNEINALQKSFFFRQARRTYKFFKGQARFKRNILTE